MARNPVTDHYTAEITIHLVERNTYGDALNDGKVTMTYKVKVNTPGGLGYLLQQLQITFDNLKEVMR